MLSQRCTMFSGHGCAVNLPNLEDCMLAESSKDRLELRPAPSFQLHVCCWQDFFVVDLFLMRFSKTESRACSYQALHQHYCGGMPPRFSLSNTLTSRISRFAHHIFSQVHLLSRACSSLVLVLYLFALSRPWIPLLFNRFITLLILKVARGVPRT